MNRREKIGASGAERTLLSLLALALFCLLPSAVQAQDEEEEAFVPPPVSKPVDGTGSVQNDLELYWGGARSEDVVTNHIYTKEGRLELGLFAGVIPNDPFLTYLPVGGRVSYFFTDALSLEVGGSWAGIQQDSDLTEFLKAENKLDTNDAILNRQYWRANAVAVWSPLYGKLALLQRKLSHFDLNLAAGLGAVQLSSPDEDTVAFAPEAVMSTQVEIVLGAGARFYVTDYFSVRIDYRQGLVPGASEELLAPVEFLLGAAFMTGESKSKLR